VDPELVRSVFSRLVADRRSCRGFLPTPVPHEQIETMLGLAQRAASWCNTQPWGIYVTEGDATERLRAALFDLAVSGAATASDVDFPPGYAGRFLERRRDAGWRLYEAVGVERGDREGSRRQNLGNFRLFGAPHVAVITVASELGPYALLDVGVYLGTLLLAAESLGIGAIPQAALALYSDLLREFFEIPPEEIVLAGVSFGWPDLEHPANAVRVGRATLEESVRWVD
jgi:nitroreductase